MIDQLYQKAILKHAAAAIGHGSLDDADHKLTHHNPLCGDRITISLKLEDETIIAFNHQTKACVLCQASASILAETIVGETKESLKGVYQDLINALTDQSLSQWPDDKWRALHVFQPVSDHKNRFTCVTLPFEATLKAFEKPED